MNWWQWLIVGAASYIVLFALSVMVGTFIGRAEKLDEHDPDFWIGG